MCIIVHTDCVSCDTIQSLRNMNVKETNINTSFRHPLFLVVVITALMLSIGISSLSAAEDEFGILQLRSGRVYFAAGVEDLVFAGAQFSIVCEDSLFAEGTIEYSGPSICWSNFAAGFEKLTLSPDCRSFIHLPDIDTLTPIRLAVFGPARSQLLLPNGSEDSLLHTQTGNRLQIQSVDQLQLEIGSARFHAAAGFRSRLRSPAFGRNPVSSKAPFVVLMIPNLASDWGADGSLTTSMYYRYDDSKPTILFEGDSAVSLYSLGSFDTLSRRLYPFAPSTGKALLANMQHHEDTVRLYAGEIALEPCVYFFADILARDRRVVKIVEVRQEADVIFEFIPLVESQPLKVYEIVLQRLEQQADIPRSARETLDLIRIRLESGQESDDETAAAYYSRLIDRTLVEDLGLFPLFRPIVYLHTTSELIAARFDHNGMIDINSLTLIHQQPTKVETEK